MRPPFALLAACWIAPLHAQTNVERVANDHYTRSHDYDLIHQRIEVSNFDWDSTSFDGRVTTTLVARRSGLDSVILDAGARLQIKTVTVGQGGRGGGGALRTSRHGDTLVVFLPRPIGFGDTARFTIAYHGVVTNGRGLTFINPEGRLHRPRQIWSQGQDDDNHFWFPTYDFPNDKMTWQLVATVPKGMTCVSNGRLVSSVTAKDGSQTFNWLQDKPSATYLVSIVVAPLVRIRETWRNVPVDYFVYPEDSSLGRRLFSVTPDMMEVFSRLTGVNYPWAKYAQATVADHFGGMENVSATTLVDWLPRPRDYQDRPWYQWILIPHELAHQWFGDYVTIENWANMWLNEGFAEFMPGQYWGRKLGARAEEDYFFDEYSQFMQIDHDRRMPLAALGSNNVYPKGALVLNMLKQYLGDQRFWASVNRFLVDHALDNATTDDFRQAVLDATGENLNWFWDQWIYQAGYPEFVVTAKYDSSTFVVTLVVQQVQKDSSKADSTGIRFTTPPAFRMPVAIRIGTAAGDVTARAQLSRRQDTIVIRDVKTAPTMVIFDEGNTILKQVSFDQPTAWLATQLQHDPNIWNRHWVITQLSQRPKDSLAGAAIVRAATSADYFRVRMAAVEALVAFPGAALPPLRAAAADTSAQVRAAALEVLGVVGGPEAAAMARRAWSRDSSDGVRAAAVTALARTDSTNRRTIVLEALKTPSYREAIQLAAYRVIAGTGDTTLIDSVAARAGADRYALHVLAALAARGSVRAIDLLVRHLDDERSYVRRWAVEAVRFTLPRPIGQPRLQAISAGGTLRFADTRQAIAELLQQWHSGGR
ncbi:MAG TPA: M1 family aminopeptidase [Gemmatimonadales bacterium]|nr:M1 family aminopeptidase [Gemmatimonadales bacterium]